MDLEHQLALARGRLRVLLLDYDGTLVPFAQAPELAAPDAALLSLLERLCRRHDTHVHVVSGRSRASLDSWLGHLPIGLHAEHGFWQRADRRRDWVAPVAGPGPWTSAVLDALAAAVEMAPGSFIEQKTACVAWHYRSAQRPAAEAALASLRDGLRPLCLANGLRILEGCLVLEVRPNNVHKGLVVERILAELPSSVFVVAIGDDLTDEDMFAALPETALTVHAGALESRAMFRVAGPTAVRGVLERLSADPEEG